MKEFKSAFAISIVALTFLLLHVFGIIEVNNQALVLLGIALVPWLFPFLKTLKLPGGTEISFQERLEQVEKQVDVIEENASLPGKKSIAAAGSAGNSSRRPQTKTLLQQPGDQRESIRAAALKEYPNDPNKGKFGGSPKAHGRVLEAIISPAYGPRSSACDVEITVRSTDPARPLTGEVEFFLHPTFGRWKQYPVDVKNGVAEDEITSWGAFTIGVEADGGATRLELDLMDVRGGTKAFYKDE